MISIIALALVSFNIPAGSADRAVRQFVEQAHLSVIYDWGRLDPFKTRAVRGEYEPVKALQLLLEGSGLTYSMTTSRFISVNPIRHRASISPQHTCDCWTIDGERTGTLWCTWRDDHSYGVDDRCRKREKSPDDLP